MNHDGRAVWAGVWAGAGLCIDAIDDHVLEHKIRVHRVVDAVVLDVGGDGEVGIVGDEFFPRERACFFGQGIERWASEPGQEPERVVGGAEVEIEAQAVFEGCADVDGDMVFFLDLVAEGFDLLAEKGCDVLGTGDACEPFFVWVDLAHGKNSEAGRSGTKNPMATHGVWWFCSRRTDREGFEPSVQVYPVHRISNPAPSASRAPILIWGW